MVLTRLVKFTDTRVYLKILRRLHTKKYFRLSILVILCFLCLRIIFVQSQKRIKTTNIGESMQSEWSQNDSFDSEEKHSTPITSKEQEYGVEDEIEPQSLKVPDWEYNRDKLEDTPKRQMFLFIAITADHKNFEARQAVRDTWLKFPRVPNWEAYFFVMQSPNSTIQRMVEEESNQFKDIVILPYLETYTNLTLKTLSIMKWIDQNINATFIFKSDDDAYVNVPRLALWLLKKPTERFYSGGVNRNSKPVRIKGHKWYVSYDEYPYKCYPDYCIGNGYIISSDLVSVLGSCLPENLSCTKDYPSCVPRKGCRVPLELYRVIGLEDITVAIILKGAVGVECVHGDGKFINEPYFYCNTNYSPRCLMGLKEPEDQNVVCNPRHEVFFIHRVVPEQMYRYHWNGPGIGANIKMCKNSSFSSYPLL